MNYRSIPLWKALLPVIFLIGMLTLNVLGVYGDDALMGSNQLILILSGAVAVAVGYSEGVRWENVEKGIADSISSAAPAIVILLLIGALSGTWMLSGVVPAMIYYGLKLLSAKIFLLACCIICALVAVVSGSSWSTVATIGIALFGIGKKLGIGEPVIAGAIISGAYFGDKLSPLSDTTNLASAMAGAPLFTHIRYMMNTTMPSFAITLLIFGGMGLFNTPEQSVGGVESLMAAIEEQFFIHPILFLVPLIVFGLIFMKVPALPALLVGTLSGALFAVVFQSETILLLSEESVSTATAYYRVVMDAMTTDIAIPSEHPVLESLMQTGGMAGMLNTVWLIIAAMVFGGCMDACGFLKRITFAFLQMVRSDFSLVGTTTGTCVAVNVLASDQYLSLVVPGKMYASAYRERKLAPEHLSRTLEDSGTVTGVLVPWNTCGAFHSAVLGVSTFAYAPYCFFNIISPLMTLLFAALKIRIARL